MFLPQPYPDEIVGSILMRGCRWTGLSFDRFIRAIVGEHVTTHSMLTTPHVAIAAACGMEPVEFARMHTLLPYAFAFHPAPDRQRQLERIVLSGKCSALGSLAQKLVRNSRRMKFCPLCADDDLRTFGETYWHRAHQLDGYLYCPQHSVRLHVTEVNVSTRKQLFPSDVHSVSNSIDVAASAWTLKGLSAGTQAALDWQHEAPDELQAYYFSVSARQGYQISSRRIAGRVFTSDFETFFGLSLLGILACRSPNRQQTTTWPARMLRRNAMQFAPIKHILLRQFLASRPMPSVDLIAQLHAPRPLKRDYALIDKTTSSKLRFLTEENDKAGRRTPVQASLNAAGVGSLIKHKRDQLPLVHAWIEKQRATNHQGRWDRSSSQDSLFMALRNTD